MRIVANGGLRRRRERAGTALVLAVVVAVAIAAFAAAALQISSMFTKRRIADEHDARAFYLAEAGLSEAYLGLTSGNSGQIGSMEQPAVAGDGVLWVDATETATGEIRLECTALSGLGRATLALTVERVEEPIGLFAEEDLVIDDVLLVDGYDSEAAPYIQQTAVDLTQTKRWLIEDFLVTHADIQVGETIVDGTNTFMLVYLDASYAYLEYVGEAAAVDSDLAFGTGWGGTGGTTTTSDPATSTQTPTYALDAPTTGGGGQIGSNGNIDLAGAAGAIYGDALPGPDGQVTASSGFQVTGRTSPRGELIELDPVEPPAVEMLPAVDWEDPLPLVIPPSEVGYDSLRIRAGSELVVQGPATLVVGSLELDADADLTVDNLGGGVSLFVLQALDLRTGARVHVLSDDPAELTLLLMPEVNPANLYATSGFNGIVYGPGAEIRVESPFEIFGALVGGTLRLGSNVRFHFDGGIAGSGEALPLPRFISWEIAEIPAEVAQRRVNPFHLLDLDPATLPTVAEAQETSSWTMQLSYWGWDGEKVNYEGPFEQFDYSLMKSYINGKLLPPEVATDLPWTVYCRYKDWKGTTRTYDGTVEDYPLSDVEYVYERVVTPPGH